MPKLTGYLVQKNLFSVFPKDSIQFVENVVNHIVDMRRSKTQVIFSHFSSRLLHLKHTSSVFG